MYDIFSLADFKFPKNFLWGSGYAGHQVEGNNANNQIWQMEEDGILEEKSGMACNSYELYDLDHSLAQNLSMKAFRTSVEWCRIEPSEGFFDEKQIEHYIAVFESAKKRGLKVFATMVHGSYPLWFHNIGNFEKAENLRYFERYLEKVVPRIAPYVDFWNVLNEFNVGSGPKRTDFKLNCIRYHALGYHIIKKYSSAPVSSAHSYETFMPLRPFDEWDSFMARYKDMCTNEFFFHAMRTGEIIYPERDVFFDKDIKGTADYWSVNIYTRHMIDSRKSDCEEGKRYDFKMLRMIDKKFYLEEMYPECIISGLARLHDKPIYITENGCCCNDDRFRIVYLSLYLSALSEAISMGADVRGYLYWSLIDNFEWGSYKPKFGLFSVNRETFERTPRPSAYFFKEIIENNGFSQKILRKYLTELPTLKK